MRELKLSMSVLAGIVFSAGAFAADAPSTPAAAPAPTVQASVPGSTAPAAPAETNPAAAAPAAADAATAAATAAAPAVEAPQAEAQPVLSQAEAMTLLKQSNCLLCHSIEKKVVGPAYRDVAAKYRGQADAEAKLFAKVTTGGKGVWGSTAMPPQMANRDNIKSLIRFVLALPSANVAKSN